MANNMKRNVVRRIIERCKTEEKRARDIAGELKNAGYKVFTASFCLCEDVVFFDTHAGLQIRIIA
ncbi:MAG: hypothetical protein PHH47_00125 [Gallionella sp.]|nr:hypothetical protein [Gallionella sp.]